MARSPTTRRFTVKDYHRMGEADIFEPDDRVELIDGEVFELAPIGSRHAATVARLNHLFRKVGDGAIVSVQSPIQVGEFSEPQPDLAILRFRADARRRPLSGAGGVSRSGVGRRRHPRPLSEPSASDRTRTAPGAAGTAARGAR